MTKKFDLMKVILLLKFRFLGCSMVTLRSETPISRSEMIQNTEVEARRRRFNIDTVIGSNDQVLIEGC